MDESSSSFLDRVKPDRRRFVRILTMAGYAVPSVRTFVMGSAAASIVPDVYAIGNGNPWRPTPRAQP